MPLRSRCVMLPPEIRARLDDELRRRHHSGFHELSALLAERGYTVGKSAIHKYSIGLRRRDGLPLRGSGLDCRSIRETDPPPAPTPPPAPPSTGDQRAAVKRHLAAGRSLNQREAIEAFGCYRLAAVIERIRRIDGWPIETIKAPGSGFGCYRLPPIATPSIARNDTMKPTVILEAQTRYDQAAGRLEQIDAALEQQRAALATVSSDDAELAGLRRQRQRLLAERQIATGDDAERAGRDLAALDRKLAKQQAAADEISNTCEGLEAARAPGRRAGRHPPAPGR